MSRESLAAVRARRCRTVLDLRPLEVEDGLRLYLGDIGVERSTIEELQDNLLDG